MHLLTFDVGTQLNTWWRLQWSEDIGAVVQAHGGKLRLGLLVGHYRMQTFLLFSELEVPHLAMALLPGSLSR